MKTIFECNEIITSTGMYEVSDVGNCCIKIVEQPSLKENYLYIKTELGSTTIIQFGPTIIDEEIVLDKFIFTIENFQYNEKRIVKTIDKFFKSLYNITEVNELEPQEFWSKLEGVIQKQICI